MRIKVCLLIGLAASYSAAAQPLPEAPHIYVEGQHTETAEPDRFSVRVSISEVASTSGAAAEAVSKRLVSLLEQAEALGVAESQIRAFEIRVAPAREWVDGKEHLVGTRVTRQLEFSHDKISAMQQLLDALVRSNIAEIHDTRAYSSQESVLHEKAIEGAVLNAKTRAENIAKSLGVKLGKVHSISEFTQHYRPMQLREFGGYALAEREKPSIGPFRPGPVEVSGHVYVVFLLKQ